jgi:hypothetical protein
MPDLKEIYGDKIFHRKATYRHSKYIPTIANLIPDLFITWAIVKIFDVGWSYAYVKVFLLIQLYGLIGYIYSYLVNLTNYLLFVKKSLAAEIKHYVHLFGGHVNWRSVATYEDLFYEAAFSKTLSPEMRVLGGINYGVISEASSSDRRLESRAYILLQKRTDVYLHGEKES